MTVAAKEKTEPAVEPVVVDEHGDDAAAVAGVELESVAADPGEHVVAMQSLLADGTPEHPGAVVLVEGDDPRAAHFEG